jgi:nitroreductase
MTNEALRAIRTWWVVRRMTAEPIDREQLITVLNGARWDPSGGNRRLHRFVAVQRPVTRRLLRMVSPGMLQHPAAAGRGVSNPPRTRWWRWTWARPCRPCCWPHTPLDSALGR